MRHTLASFTALLLALAGISPITSAAEPAPDVFLSVITAEDLDLGQTTEFPANADLQTLVAERREAFTATACP
jgi:hypothetical protein